MIDANALAAIFANAKVLWVDDEHYMRKVVRTIYEAADGPAGIETIRSMAPDVVILDRGMPGLDGTSFVRMVRSPLTFPLPDVPIITLSGYGERTRVIEAIQAGINEFLLKPVSFKSLQDRLVSVLPNPPMVQTNDYYGPAPRKMAAGIHADTDRALTNLVMLN